MNDFSRLSSWERAWTAVGVVMSLVAALAILRTGLVFFVPLAIVPAWLCIEIGRGPTPKGPRGPRRRPQLPQRC